TVRDGCIYRQDARTESGLQIYFEPRFQACALLCLGKSLYPLADFAKGHYAQIEQILIRSIDPIQDAPTRLDTNEFGYGIRVQQESAHRSMWRPVSALRSNFNSIPTRGDSRKNWTRLLGRRAFSCNAAKA